MNELGGKYLFFLYNYNLCIKKIINNDITTIAVNIHPLDQQPFRENDDLNDLLLILV